MTYRSAISTALALCSLFWGSADGLAGFPEQVTATRRCELQTADVHKSLDLLEETVRNLSKTIPADMVDDVLKATAERLELVRAEATQHATIDHGSALLTVRILELDSVVASLQAKRIAETAALRKQASDQYAAMREKLEAEAAARSIKAEVLSLVLPRLNQPLHEAERDPLASGYGYLLAAVERKKLEDILNQALDQAAQFSKATGDADLQPSQKTEAFKLAMSAEMAVHKYLRDKATKGTTGMLIWNDSRGVRDLRDRASKRLRETETKEATAIVERARRESRRMMDENAPERIENEQKQEEIFK